MTMKEVSMNSSLLLDGSFPVLVLSHFSSMKPQMDEVKKQETILLSEEGEKASS
jgi:hypothetical protein